MKTRNTILALLFVIMLGVSSCATLIPPAVEQEEEVTTPSEPSTWFDEHMQQLREERLLDDSD